MWMTPSARWVCINCSRGSRNIRIGNVTTPLLYVKTGCPYCKAAIEYLDEHEVAYEKVEVRSSPEGLAKLEEISGQNKTPTLDWDGEVLADFGVDELKEFLADREQDG